MLANIRIHYAVYSGSEMAVITTAVLSLSPIILTTQMANSLGLAIILTYHYLHQQQVMGDTREPTVIGLFNTWASTAIN